MIRIIYIAFFSLCSVGLSAQLINELISITQRDYVLWNPATIAIDGRPSAGLMYKDQNVGLEKAPAYFSANYQLPIRFQNSAFAAALSKDYLGDLRQTKLSVAYRYSLFNHRLDDQRAFVGLSTDFKHDRLLAGNHIARDNDDPLVYGEAQSDLGIDLNIGAFYQLLLPSAYANGDQVISAGLSLNRIISNDAVFDSLGTQASRPRQLFGLLGYELELGLFDLDVRYFISGGGNNVNNTILVGLKNISYMSFSLGYSTSKDLIVAWGFSLTDFNDSAIEADISLYYGLDDISDENKSGLQLSVRYLFEPKPWTTSDFR